VTARRTVGPAPRCSITALALAAALLVGAGVIELAAPPTDEPIVLPQLQTPAVEGMWYCPVTADPGETAMLSVAATGSTPAWVGVEHYRDGVPRPGPLGRVDPGQQLDVPLDGDLAQQPAAVRWEGGPAVVTWRRQDAALPCTAVPSDRWYLTGFDTVGDSRSLLHLFNPFSEDAVARVTYATPDGPVALSLTDDLVVEGGAVLRLDLREYQPEIADLAVTVEVLIGRLVAAGEVVLDPPGDARGPTGRALLPAAGEPSRDWTFPFARVDDRTSSWLSLMNPSNRAAAVEVRVSEARTAGIPAEVSVAAGGVEHLDLAELSSKPEFAVAVRSVNHVPLLASRFIATRDAQDRPAVAASLGASAPGSTWALVGGGAGERAGTVGVFNPGGKAAVVSLAAEGAPASWSSLKLPPNSLVTVELADAGSARRGVPVVVRADRPVVAELRSSGPGPEFWTTVGVPEGAWSGPRSRTAVRWDPGVSRIPALPPTDAG
jgi:Family of unknown function (DUF5719)